MRIVDEVQLDFDDVLIMPKRSSINSRSEIDLTREFRWTGNDNKEHILNAIPVSVANMGTVGVPEVAKIMAENGMMCCMEKHIDKNTLKELIVSSPKTIFPSIGIKESVDDLVELNNEIGLTGICIDVPNGYIPNLLKRVEELAKKCPNCMLIAGNVVTPDMTQDILNAGATVVKINIGNGSACLTRKLCGVGRPTLSTIIECADACHQMGKFCMSDGGMNVVGDICKAFGAGADMVMSGSMFAGCDEAAGDIFVDGDGKKFKRYYGMSSHYAQNKHFGGIRNYSASEGREKLIPCTGSLQSKIDEIKGGIRSCMTYIGAKKIKNISRQTTFYRVNRQLNTMFAGCKDF